MVNARLGGDRFGGIEGEVGGKHGKPAQNRRLLAAQQIVTPVNGGHQGLLPGQRGTAPAGEQPETVTQPFDQLLKSDRPQSHRGQLQRQRHAVEVAA